MKGIFILFSIFVVATAVNAEYDPCTINADCEPEAAEVCCDGWVKGLFG